MAFPYDSNLRKSKIVEISNLDEEHVQLGTTSTKIVSNPLFILPNGKVYSSFSDHYNANFYIDIVDNIGYLEDYVRRLEIVDSFPYNDKEKTSFYKQKDFNNNSMNEYLYLYAVDDVLYLYNTAEYWAHKVTPEIYDALCKKFDIDFTFAKIGCKFNFDYFAYLNDLYEKTKTIVVDYRDDLAKLKKADSRYEESYRLIGRNGISLQEARSYINRSCFDLWSDNYCSVDKSTRGFYNNNGDEIVKRLIEAKRFVLSGIIELVLKAGGNDLLSQFEEILELPYYVIEDGRKKVNNHFLQDFSVMFLGFDKIESQVRNTISSSRFDLYKEYFNYDLMNWNLVQLPKVVLDESTKRLKKVYADDFSLAGMRDDKYREEAQLIKKKVPLSERHNYFI